MVKGKITLIEFHSHGAGPSILPNVGMPSEEEVEPEHTSDPENGRSRGLALVIGLLALIGFAFIVNHFRGNDEESAPSFDTEQVHVTEYEE